MIKNERQYDITAREAAKFELALAELRRKAENESDDEERSWLDVFEAAIMSQLSDLRAQLAEYDALRSGESIQEPIESLASLPRALIRGRIAAGLSQEELAERLARDPAEIARAEADEYASTSLGLLLAVARELGVAFHGDLTIPGAHVRAAD